MGILDDYMSGVSSSEAAPVAVVAKPNNIINEYMNTPDNKPKIDVYRAPKPPISGATAEQSAEINAMLTTQGGANPREGLSDVASKASGKVYEAAKSGVLTAGSGIGDIFSGQPATGVGKIGSGALGVIGSPFEGISSVGSDISGSEDIGNRLGFIAGAVPVGKVVNAVAQSLPKNKALTTLVDKITSNGRDPQALADTITKMKADPRIGPVDTSPAVLNMTQKLFTTEGDAAKNHLFNTSKNRVANLPQDVTEAYNTAGGVPVNVVQKLSNLSEASKKVGNDLINPALAKAKPVDVSNTLSSIDNILKPGVWSKVEAESSLPLSNVKKELANIKGYLANKTEMRTDANELHKFQSGLRKTAESLLSSSMASERQLGFELSKVRNNLVNDIETSAPGYKAGLSAYRDEKNIAEAFRHAHDDVFSKSTKIENAPEVTKRWFDKLSDQEKEAAKEGARLAVRSKMGASDNASLSGTNFARSEFNQEKLKTIFGGPETEKLLKDLENTRAIKNTDQKITEGSQTEMRRAGDQAVALPVKGEGSPLSYALPIGAEYLGTLAGTPGVGGILGAGAIGAFKVGSAAKHAIDMKLAKERNLHLAKMALPIEGPARTQLISDLESFLPKPKQSLMTRIANRLPISP